MMCWIFHFI